MLSPWQRIVADNYGDGDYTHIENVDEARDVGDTLFTFLMIELDPKQGCENWDEAVRRIEVAQRQVDEIVDRINHAAPEDTNG